MILGANYGLAQINQFNNLCTNNTNLQLSNTFYDFKFKTPASCSQDQNDSYKSINYYKVVADGSFEFVLRSSKLVNYHVWVLSETELNNFYLNKESRYDALRSSYTATNNEKGLYNTAIDNCEFYGSADGKLMPLTVTTGQYIVIGVLGADINTNFSITPGGTAIVCEPEPRPGDAELSGRCSNDAYSIAEVKDKVKSEIFADYGQTIDNSNIKIFSSRTSTNEITTDINSSAGLNQTYVAKIYNGSRVDYIYDVRIV